MERSHSCLRFSGKMRLFVTVVALATLAAAPAAHAQPPPGPRVPPYLPTPSGAAVIMNTGSTNAAGYRIVITPQGSIEYASAGQRTAQTVSAELAGALFSDIAKAAPLDKLPAAACMKSASFGSSLFVWSARAGRSPDLLCPTDTRGAALAADAQRIAHELGVGQPGAPVVRPMLPGEQHMPYPSPSA